MTAADCWDRRSLPLQSAKSKSWRLMCISRRQRSKPSVYRDATGSCLRLVSPAVQIQRKPNSPSCYVVLKTVATDFSRRHSNVETIFEPTAAYLQEKRNTPISPMFMTAGQEVFLSLTPMTRTYADEAEAKRADVEEPPP